MGRGSSKAKTDPYQQRPDETGLQWRARIARMEDEAASRKQPLVTPEAAANGQYEDGYTEVDGQRAAVKINRGGSTIQRWMNSAPCRILDDAERAAIRYCQSLWTRLDYSCPGLVYVDFGRDGMTDLEVIGELATLKGKVPLKYWTVFENICRFELPATDRHAKTTVGFVAGMIALWRNL